MLTALAALSTAGVAGAGPDQSDDTENASGSEIDPRNQIEIEDTIRITIRSSCPGEDPITAVARVAGTVQRLAESEGKSKNGEVWAVAAEIIEAPVEYARIEGTIDDEVSGEDHEDGVLLTMEPCIRVSDPQEPSVDRSSRISISLLVSDSGASIV
ncbi:hypothetical protein [Halalkalicoccus salilacus]|uniref:hypothetical protein n=1 Tax=Halalkalicoccus salilacus TaxID=3117459 RepID=UPI00300E7DCF